MVKKYQYSVFKHLSFLQRSKFSVFLVAGSRSSIAFSKFLSELRSVVKCDIKYMFLNAGIMRKLLAKRSFWFSGSVLIINVQDSWAEFLQFLFREDYLFRSYFLVGFKYMNQLFSWDGKVNYDLFYVKSKFIDMYFSMFIKLNYILNWVFNLLQHILYRQFNIFYANVQSTFFWISFWKEKAA